MMDLYTRKRIASNFINGILRQNNTINIAHIHLAVIRRFGLGNRFVELHIEQMDKIGLLDYEPYNGQIKIENCLKIPEPEEIQTEKPQVQEAFDNTKVKPDPVYLHLQRITDNSGKKKDD